MKEWMVVCAWLMAGYVLDSRVVQSAPKQKAQNDSAHYNDISHWDKEQTLLDKARVREALNDQDRVIAMLKSMSQEIVALRTQVSNVKYQNHLIYRQLKKNTNKCPAPAVAIQATQPELPTCPQDYIWNPTTRSCYLFVSERITWRMAREKCLAQDGDLVSIETVREQRFITETARKTKDLRHCDFWTSLSDGEQEGKWRWLGTGRSPLYTNWNLNEPNNGNGDEHCMHMLWVFSWAWNDARCNYDNSCYICEIHTKERALP